MKAQTVTVVRTVGIDAEALPAHELDRLTRETVRAARRFFALPGVAEDYDAWLARQQAAGRYLDEGGETA